MPEAQLRDAADARLESVDATTCALPVSLETLVLAVASRVRRMEGGRSVVDQLRALSLAFVRSRRVHPWTVPTGWASDDQDHPGRSASA